MDQDVAGVPGAEVFEESDDEEDAEGDVAVSSPSSQKDAIGAMKLPAEVNGG